jgi:hypothetical protein
MEIKKQIAGATILFCLVGYLLVGLTGLLMFIFGALVVLVVEAWLFLNYLSRDPDEINQPLRVIY